MSEAVSFLKQTYFFGNLSDAALHAMVAACTGVYIPSGEVVFHEGDAGDRLFILLSGEVEVWRGYNRVEGSCLAVHGPGCVFGEMALVDDLPRSATAITAEDSALLFLLQQDFHGLVHEYPELALSVMRSLSAIVRTSNDSFVMDLRIRNEQLEDAYAQLEQAQLDLLRNDRLSNLGKMSNMILHDIRNPVAVLKGYAAMLHQSADDPVRVHDFARRIGIEAERLSHLAGELLDYTRGEMRLDLAVVLPSAVARAAVLYVEERHKPFSVVLNIDRDHPVVMDQNRMVRVLMNLLENAYKACKGGGEVSLTVKTPEAGVIFTVRDTGAGIPREMQDKIFEPFFSYDENGGTGLGLLIVRTVVETHGGTVQLSSSPGAGTEIVVSLPGTY
jgi:signal transduction histidine kinase